MTRDTRQSAPGCARPPLTNLCQLCCEVGHVQVRVHVYTGCIRCRFCKAEIGKNVLLLRETAHIVLLMEKVVLREFGHAIV